MSPLRVLDIVEGTSVDGPGLRTSIYFAGCTHHCPGCHNPESWDPQGGREYTVEEIMKVIDRSGFNVTLSGGDPLMQTPQIIQLAQQLRDKGYTLWCYTGYLWETIVGREPFCRLLPLLEVMVDGPFVQSLRDTQLLFRGSSNQRLIDVPRSLTAGNVVLWSPG